MSTTNLDDELMRMLGQLPWTAKRDLLAIAGWMLAADRLFGGRFDGYPVTGRPELMETSDCERQAINVYKRSAAGDLTYVGSRPCCSGPMCGCRFGEWTCEHNTGDVFAQFSPEDRAPERAGKDPIASAADDESKGESGVHHDPN